MNEPLNSEVAILNAALELPGGERAAYLDKACAGNDALHEQVEALLLAHEQAESFLEAPPAGLDLKRTVKVNDPLTEKPGDKIGRYKLLQQIGEGGCGVVYMAEQEEPVRRRVALKVIKLGMDTKQVIARFEAERQALALMDHPNIAKVFDAGSTERPLTRPAGTLSPVGGVGRGEGDAALSMGRPYFVMELVRGTKITDNCNENKVSTADRLKLFVQVCQAIQHAHQKGVIHRDIKPSNILVTINDGVPVPKVIDFGIAKATQGRLTDHTLFTAFEQFIGTPAYMSPEQAVMTSLDIDTRSDIYSLGVLLYELLTGRTPFDQKELFAAGLDEMRRTIREVEPVKPSTRLTQELLAANASLLKSRGSSEGKVRADSRRLLHEVRGDLDWIVMKCLEKDRARRYETSNGLAADLARHLNDEPVVARPPSRVYEFQKTVRRHKFGFAAAAAILLVLAGGITLTAWQAVRATRAERQESVLREEAEKARQNEAGLRQTAQSEANRAEAAAMEAKRTLSVSDFLQAVRFIAEDNANDALPFLARSLSANPANDAALTRLTTLLTYHSWMLPTLILKHERPVNSAEFSSDGKRIVTGSGDGTAQIWDAGTGQPLVEPMKHSFSVASAGFSPDGKRVVTGSADGTVRMWDAQTGQPVTEPMKHGIPLTSVHFSPDGKRIVTGLRNNTARVWDGETGQPLTEPMVHDNEPTPPGAVYSVNVVTPVGSVPVSGSSFKAVAAQFSPDGERIVTASEAGTARVWDARTGQPLTHPMKHGSGVRAGQFSPDGKRIVTVSSDNTTRVWDAQTGQPLTGPMKHGSGVAAAQFRADGKRIVSVSHDHTARVWDAQTGRLLTEPMQHVSGVRAGQFSPDGERVLTASGDNAVYVLEARTGPPLPLRPPLLLTWLNNEPKWFRPQFSHDGRRIVMPSADKTARVWDAQTGEPLSRMMHDSEVVSAQFSVDDKRIVTVSQGGTARVWDAQTGQSLTEPMKHEGYLYSVEFSPDGKRIVTASEDRTARIWDEQTGQPLTEPLKHGGRVNAAQFSPDGKRIVTASWDKTARVWDAQAGKPLTEPLKHGGNVSTAQFSPDGTRIVTASWDETARVWDAQMGQPLTEPMKHGGGLIAAQFSPDGKRILTASQYGDATARVWDAQTGQPVTKPISPGGAVCSARFSPDGKRIVTAALLLGRGGKPRVWDVAPTQAPCPDWLLQLAEAISGKVLNKEGALEPTRLNRVETLNQIRQKLAEQPDDDWVVWGRWLLADRATRTISPFAKVTVPDYIENRIKEKTRQSLDEAEQLAAGKPEVLQRISEARETHMQPKK